jgi:hypothetical protein
MQVSSREHDLRVVWNQGAIPVFYRGGKGHPLKVRLPYAVDNRPWLASFGRRNPIRHKDEKYWELPTSWFNDLVNGALKRYGKVYIIQPFRMQEKCAPACWNATGHECQCSCMGQNHGVGDPGRRWFIVSETFATKWHDMELACRLLTKT